MAKKKGLRNASILILFAVFIWIFRLFSRKIEKIGKPFDKKENLDQHEPDSMPEITLDTAIEDVQAAVDDLRKIKGIGPKISAVLNQAGIRSYQKLAETSPEDLEMILKDAGVRLANYHSWPNQALLALSTKSEESEENQQP